MANQSAVANAQTQCNGEAARQSRLLLCARLADYAYVSGKPGVSGDELSAKRPQGYRIVNPSTIFTRSWYQESEHQHRFFKSHAYVCQLKNEDKSDNVNRIVVGFRGTWLHKNTSPGRANGNGGVARAGVLSRLSNFFLDVFGPSNYGLSDLYYDATLIRVPYRTGVIWKWYAYWGSLVLEGSNWARDYLAWPRQVAAGLIYRPDGYVNTELRYPLVHLGFWALWASPEGFAGYDRYGHLWKDQKSNGSQEHQTPREPVREGALQSVLQRLQESDESQKTEILVVGHSLGGAVSCFAALDIVAELRDKDKYRNVKVFHATFGAPPVGTTRFAEFFRNKMQGHESFAVFHERDIIAKCFAWCGSIPAVRCLGWWSNWSRAGEERIIRKPGIQASHASQRENGLSWRALLRASMTTDGLKSCGILVGTLLFLGFSSLTTPLSILITPVCWLVDWKYYSKQKNPPSHWEDTESEDHGNTQALSEDPNLKHVALEYHSLEKYIELLEGPDPFGDPEHESNGPSEVEQK
ncbi:hypothetical protein S40293_11255 [Stachybotrys chartarum IBT 40293]|nr:hypothetical protein S40293_11255 [Stachybotrys chartarum IBT 40293]